MKNMSKIGKEILFFYLIDIIPDIIIIIVQGIVLTYIIFANSCKYYILFV